MNDKRMEEQESQMKLQQIKKKCCQTDPEIKICGCKSKKEKSKLMILFNKLFKGQE